MAPRHPWQLRRKSTPLILRPWRCAGSRDCLHVFQVFQFRVTHRMWYLAALRQLPPKFHLTRGQVHFSPPQPCVSWICAARLLSAPLPLSVLFSLPTSSLSSSLLVCVWKDDVKLKNGVSWWADGGGTETNLFHVHICVLLSANLAPPPPPKKKKDFGLLSPVKNPPIQLLSKVHLPYQTFILLSNVKHLLLISWLLNVS